MRHDYSNIVSILKFASLLTTIMREYYCTVPVLSITSDVAPRVFHDVQFSSERSWQNLQYDTKVRTFKLTVTDGGGHPEL
jgi:hypothetical protein